MNNFEVLDTIAANSRRAGFLALQVRVQGDGSYTATAMAPIAFPDWVSGHVKTETLLEKQLKIEGRGWEMRISGASIPVIKNYIDAVGDDLDSGGNGLSIGYTQILVPIRHVTVTKEG